MLKILPIFILLGAMTAYQGAYANLPVFDGVNLAESIKQTLQQVEQYKLQMQQYQNMMNNSKNLDKFSWDKASLTMDNLIRSIDTLKLYKDQSGGMDAYLSGYQDLNYYQSSSCLNGSGCNSSQMQALWQQEVAASMAQKRANDAMLRNLDEQQQAMLEDARRLELLQQQAQDATGQMQAIQAGNQLASAEAHQLLQIRGLLIAEQNAAATRAAALADREALQAAGDARFRAGTFVKSSGKTW